MSYGIQLHVWGEFACFTRPEMKAERVSYDVITPSAARGILEAIYWKPQIRWVIDKLHILAPTRFTNIRRNEVGRTIPTPSKAILSGTETTPLGIHIEEDRQQRAALILRDVAYVIEAHFDLIDRAESEGKHLDMFNRRARRGQYFHHPYLGTREFPASFALLENGNFPATKLAAADQDRDFGFMLHDIDFEQDPRTKKVRETTARFYPAKMKGGTIDVRECLKNSPLAQ